MGVFAHDIESALPYHEVPVVGDDEDPIADTALIDGERLIFFFQPNLDEYAILVYAME